MRTLHGPFPFDPAVAQASARTALAAFFGAARTPGWTPPEVPPFRPPGLYLLVDLTDGQARLAGFWLVCGAWYLRSGAPGAPERTPPYAGAFLDAATESVWWQRPVTPLLGQGWRPLVVIEWPPALAARASSPPPGVVSAVGVEESAADEGGSWMLPARPAQMTPRLEAGRVAGPDAVTTRVPSERSLLLVVRGHLEHDASAHRGRFFVVHPDRFGEPGAVVPFEEWSSAGATPAQKAAPPDAHSLDVVLDLPRGGVGYPMSGWLTRALDLWPARPADVYSGTLAPRDVRAALATQIQLTVLLTICVFAPILGLALLVRSLTTPAEVSAQRPELGAPQPAISVCSADHQKFMDEYRCQVQRLVDGYGPEDVVCGDEGASDELTATVDQQAEVCGLVDRMRDARAVEVVRNGETTQLDPSEFAAAQACFNVLGHPEPYELRRAPTDPVRRLASVAAFMDEPTLRIAPLAKMVTDLDVVCDGYRHRLEARVEGAVFATHLGLPAPPSGTTEEHELRESLITQALSENTSSADAACFRAGAVGGLGFDSWRGVCGEPVVPGVDAEGRAIEVGGEPPSVDAEVWTRLRALDPAAASAGGVVDRYVRARFGGEARTSDPLWTCFLDLNRAVGPSEVTVAWDQHILVPHALDVGAGAVRAQLALDALLPSLRGGGAGASASLGACWPLVAQRLTHYSPVHPIAGAEEGKVAWSVEQQVCAQTCAAAYGLGSAPAPWITPKEDVRTCVDTSARGTAGESSGGDVGTGQLDRLRMPWMWDSARARGPKITDVCAFNLIAEDLLPAGDAGLLVGTTDPAAWAGETTPGSGIAGGADGMAATGAYNLETQGQSRSRETCANVAAQCLVGLFVEVAADPKIERYRWPAQWQAEVEAVPRAAARTRTSSRTPTADDVSPWCSIIAPHLSPTGALPDGQLDYPCAMGIEEERQRVLDMVSRAARGETRLAGGNP